MSSYQKLMGKLEAMTVDRRFKIMADLWPRLPAALQVALLGLVYAMLGEINADALNESLVEVTYQSLHGESPESANTG